MCAQGTLLNLLKGPVDSTECVIRLLDALRFEYSPHEAAFIKRSGMLPFLQSLARGRQPDAWACQLTPEIQQAASLLFTTLMMLSFRVGSTTRPTPTAPEVSRVPGGGAPSSWRGVPHAVHVCLR